MYPFPLTSTGPLSSELKPPRLSSSILVSKVIWILMGSPVDCILEATLTVSPKRQYRGILAPTTPAVVAPLWIPILRNIMPFL